MDAERLGNVLVGVVMGSRNDFAVMRGAAEVLAEFGIAHEVRVVSAHRTPDLLFEYADAAVGRGLRVIIAGAGGAAYRADAEGCPCRDAGDWCGRRDERWAAGYRDACYDRRRVAGEAN